MSDFLTGESFSMIFLLVYVLGMSFLIVAILRIFALYVFKEKKQ
jgi:hypothetical protein